MITLVTVLIKEVKKYLPLFYKSLNQYSKIISEVLICDATKPSSYIKTWNNYKIIGSRYNNFRHNFDISQDHAFSLYQMVERAKNEFIYISDIDVFLHISTDELYLELMNKYNLSIIGVARNNPNIYSQGLFPSVVNMMLKKSDLPTQDWLRQFNIDFANNPFSFNLSWRKTKPTFDKLMARPNCHYDTGCLLYLWALEKKWNWASFITHDLHNYSTTPCVTNANNIKLDKIKLLYHQSGSTGPGAFEQYKKAFDNGTNTAI